MSEHWSRSDAPGNDMRKERSIPYSTSQGPTKKHPPPVHPVNAMLEPTHLDCKAHDAVYPTLHGGGAGGPGGLHHLPTCLDDGIVADDSTDDDNAMPMIWMTAHLVAMTLYMDMISVVM